MKIIIDIPNRIIDKGLIPTNWTDVEIVAEAIANGKVIVGYSKEEEKDGQGE